MAMNNQWNRIFSRMDCPVRQIHNLYIIVKYNAGTMLMVGDI